VARDVTSPITSPSRLLGLCGVGSCPASSRGTKAAAALGRLVRWPGYRYPLTPLLEEAWTYRHNLVIADALYVVLAVRLKADLITGDRRLANAPTLPSGLNVVTLPSVV